MYKQKLYFNLTEYFYKTDIVRLIANHQ